MAKWKTFNIKEIINEMSAGRIVLPVIQRELVWEPEKIIALFETVFKKESFGGIMTVIDPPNRKPLFEFRHFTSEFQPGQLFESKSVTRLDVETTYVIDGQQRLSALLIGIKGQYENKALFFDLLSEHKHKSYNFFFAKDYTKLPTQIDDYEGKKKLKPLWHKVSQLYSQFEYAGYDHESIIDTIVDESMDASDKEKVKGNLYVMQTAFFGDPIVGLCGVHINKNVSETQNRLNIVRLFQKLNQGGTILSGLELMRSVLKAYSAYNEAFLNEMKSNFSDIGFDQDEIIKLVFLLQDNHLKDIIDIDQVDSDFIRAKGERISKALEGTRNFLKHAGLYDYYTKCHPSLIPLPFIAYHLFHLSLSDSALPEYFDNYEIGNKDFIPVRKWLIMSVLNNVFQRGNGWEPRTTGRRKILTTLASRKNQTFPVEALFAVYKTHPIEFDNALCESWDWLNWYDRNFVIYLLYGKPSNFRQNDIDHIHPKSVLAAKGVEWNKINLLGNFEYLYYSDNRSKQHTELFAWLANVFKDDKQKLREYLQLHLIPDNEELWHSDKYEEFLEARRTLIFRKLQTVV